MNIDTKNLKDLSEKGIELIATSAIWYKEIKPITNKKFNNPINIHEGLVVSGHRHSDIIKNVYNMLGKRSVMNGPDSVGDYIQGFVTNQNKFVNRKEAFEIAKKANQIIEGKTYSKIELYSEDLW